MAGKTKKIKIDPSQLNNWAAQAKVWISALKLALNGARTIINEKKNRKSSRPFAYCLFIN